MIRSSNSLRTNSQAALKAGLPFLTMCILPVFHDPVSTGRTGSGNIRRIGDIRIGGAVARHQWASMTSDFRCSTTPAYRMHPSRRGRGARKPLSLLVVLPDPNDGGCEFDVSRRLQSAAALAGFHWRLALTKERDNRTHLGLQVDPFLFIRDLQLHANRNRPFGAVGNRHEA